MCGQARAPTSHSVCNAFGLAATVKILALKAALIISFLISFGPLVLTETWILPDELFGAILLYFKYHFTTSL